MQELLKGIGETGDQETKWRDTYRCLYGVSEAEASRINPCELYARLIRRDES